MPYLKEHENIYRAFDKFVQRCLLNKQSLIWPDKRIWTLENLYRLKSMFADESIGDSKMSFEAKLELQLETANLEIWAIVADLFYVYVLPSSSLTFEKKQSYLQWAAGKAKFRLPDKEDELWEPFSNGFIHTGIQYHKKFGQILLILLFAMAIKESDDAEEILGEPKKLETLLDKIVLQIKERFNIPPRDMRQVILYLKFPQLYESIISTTGKENIVQYYAEKFSMKVPDNLDEALLMIRSRIEKNLDESEKPIHFYRGKYKSEWDPNSRPIVVPSKGVGDREPDQEPDPQLTSILHALGFSKNLILSGPPGTGKTYLANKAALNLIEPQIKNQLSPKAKAVRLAEGLTFYDILAIDLYHHGNKPISVPEIEQHDLVQGRFVVRPVQNPRQNIWNYLQSHTAPDSATVKVSRRAEPYLFEKDENSKWFLTEEGKNYVEQNLSDIINALKEGPEEYVAEDFIRKITFHQSFAYEDFIEGIRPRMGEEETGEISYEVSPGVFSEICRLAINDPDNKYVLIIDEINRGNISKVFGELITLIEDDKRGKMVVSLPNSKRDFTVPENLYLIGTMNTADRSIALMDVALRRRFTFIEMMPRIDLLENEYVVTSEIELNLGKLLQKLNAFIQKEIDRNHQIGHSYFLRIAEVDQKNKLPMLNFVWNHQIFPLLQEYFYRQHDKLIEFLSPFRDEGSEINLEDLLKEGDDLLFALYSISTD